MAIESRFPGLHTVLGNADAPQQEEIDDDIEGEQETLPDLEVEDTLPSEATSQWRETIASASKGVSAKTDGDYERLAKQGAAYLVSIGLIAKPENFLCNNPPEDAPGFIIACIMNECDEFKLDGERKPKDVAIGTYSYATKIRAAMTHIFGRIHELGSVAWYKDEKAHCWRGNPSVSQKVSMYMVGLRNRKTRAGETPTSARAITTNTIRKLYDYNHLPENFKLQSFAPGNRQDKSNNIHHWGGPTARRELQAIYAIAFLCLLRSDEVLKIRCEHIQFNKEKLTFTLTLPFRKTHQDGGIIPFVLHSLPPEEAHLCPVRALADWIECSMVTSGHIFRKMASGDRVSAQDAALTSEQFLEMFRNNLLDVGVDPTSYGTHSFRRGGCQYLSADRRWGLRRICEWGGWSADFSNLTIVKYLISWNDDPREKREDFFDPNRAPVIKCFFCGRTCSCDS